MKCDNVRIHRKYYWEANPYSNIQELKAVDVLEIGSLTTPHSDYLYKWAPVEIFEDPIPTSPNQDAKWGGQIWAEPKSEFSLSEPGIGVPLHEELAPDPGTNYKNECSLGTRLTTDPLDPRLHHGGDDKERNQNEVYLVLPQTERVTDAVRPFRNEYRHLVCDSLTSMGRELSETYAKDPKFYSFTYCCKCRKHSPVNEFVWTADGKAVGS